MKFDSLSFILGLFAADGNIDKSRIRIFCSKEEVEFFRKFVSPKIQKLFKIEPKIRLCDTNCYVLAINSAPLERIFRRLFNYTGKKKDGIQIPKILLEKPSFISGLVAGDGSVVISRNNSKIRKYPMLKFTNSSRELIGFFLNFLEENNVSYYIYHDDKRESYCITVKGNEFKKLLNIIQIVNPIQKIKLDILNKIGYLPNEYMTKMKLSNAPVV